MATDLVSLTQARQHLKLDADTFGFEADDITLKLAQATALVLVHIDREVNEWAADTDPTLDLEFAIVQAAILETLGDLYRYRGDDPDTNTDTQAGAYLRPNVRRKLHPLRRPALA